jgi:hypothetical protein
LNADRRRVEAIGRIGALRLAEEEASELGTIETAVGTCAVRVRDAIQTERSAAVGRASGGRIGRNDDDVGEVGVRQRGGIGGAVVDARIDVRDHDSQRRRPLTL